MSIAERSATSLRRRPRYLGEGEGEREGEGEDERHLLEAPAEVLFALGAVDTGEALGLGVLEKARLEEGSW